MTYPTDTVLLVERAMTETERSRFLDRFVGLNPHWEGAHTSDVLDWLLESDANLEVVEPMYETHHTDVDESRAPSLLAILTLATLYTYDKADWSKISDLLNRVNEVLDYG